MGLANIRTVGTVTLEVVLHENVTCTQEFDVVKNIGGMILLGRKFLQKFESLQVKWKTMELKIGYTIIRGEEVIQGGTINTRVHVAHEKTTTDKENLEEQIEGLASSNTFLNNSQKNELRHLLIKYKDLFIPNPKNPPEAHLVSHVINTKDSNPTRDKMRRLPPKWRDEIESQIQEMLRNGICRESAVFPNF